MTKTEEYKLIEQAKESIEQYRKLQLFIEYGLHEMLQIRDMMQKTQNDRKHGGHQDHCHQENRLATHAQ